MSVVIMKVSCIGLRGQSSEGFILYGNDVFALFLGLGVYS